MPGVDLQGAFTHCPVPTLIIEGKWDLTWNTDKPKKLKANHPRAKLVVLKKSSHSPFVDEPEKFFETLGQFMKDLREIRDKELARWKTHLAEREERLEKSPAYLLTRCGWGRKSNAKIVRNYSKGWLDQLNNPTHFLKTGFALYDVKKYKDSLDVFRRMADKLQGNKFYLGVSLIWQGHVLDLMRKRAEAKKAYKQAVDLNLESSVEHSQFGIAYSISSYAAERLKEPFTRKENQWVD